MILQMSEMVFWFQAPGSRNSRILILFVNQIKWLWAPFFLSWSQSDDTLSFTFFLSLARSPFDDKSPARSLTLCQKSKTKQKKNQTRKMESRTSYSCRPEFVHNGCNRQHWIELNARITWIITNDKASKWDNKMSTQTHLYMKLWH